MPIVSQRQLRNDNAEVIRGVEHGETYVVTRRGVPVAQIGPLVGGSDLRCVRPARKRPKYAELVRVQLATPSADLLDDLRGDR